MSLTRTRFASDGDGQISRASSCARAMPIYRSHAMWPHSWTLLYGSSCAPSWLQRHLANDFNRAAAAVVAWRWKFEMWCCHVEAAETFLARVDRSVGRSVSWTVSGRGDRSTACDSDVASTCERTLSEPWQRAIYLSDCLHGARPVFRNTVTDLSPLKFDDITFCVLRCLTSI